MKLGNLIFRAKTLETESDDNWKTRGSRDVFMSSRLDEFLEHLLLNSNDIGNAVFIIFFLCWIQPLNDVLLKLSLGTRK